MNTLEDEISQLSQDFVECQKILTALGDTNRQYLILEMMKIENCSGVRVVEITERTHLSRPAVSHHLQILKDAGILKMRREGTKNYYYFDREQSAIQRLIDALTKAKAITSMLPDDIDSDEA
ncbi:MAG: metalloregulator ArsR/SmtB family transcription factor [Lachnospiraceae bacterium]|nr:metalloregulator ArsR/SmtB family transcription factor [Lachnospiraceae bacterium]